MSNLQHFAGFTGALSKAGLAEGTNANTIKIAAPNGAGVDYAINGVIYHKADTDNIAMTALAIQPALYTCIYGVDINASGDVSLVKGTQVLTALVTDYGIVPQAPDPVADKARLGYLKIKTDNAATFTSGSTDLSASDVVDTYFDVIGDVQPQVFA